jgi:hypothetical protein
VPDEEPVIVKRKLPAPALVSVSLAQPIAPAEVASEPVRIAQATPAPTDAPASANRGEADRAQPAPKAVPAQPPNPSPAEEAQIADLEVLVTRLISLYEAGDIDKLVALVDPATIGTVEGASLHRDFNEFFRATRTRQLVLRKISWNAASPPTRARGEALLQVAYRDRPDRFERVVAVDVGIAWRNGRPWIARLSLFPHE